jgi:hypothetical protein
MNCTIAHDPSHLAVPPLDREPVVATIRPAVPFSPDELATIRAWLAAAAEASDYFARIALQADRVEVPGVVAVEGIVPAYGMAATVADRIGALIGRPLDGRDDQIESDGPDYVLYALRELRGAINRVATHEAAREPEAAVAELIVRSEQLAVALASAGLIWPKEAIRIAEASARSAALPDLVSGTGGDPDPAA